MKTFTEGPKAGCNCRGDQHQKFEVNRLVDISRLTIVEPLEFVQLKEVVN